MSSGARGPWVTYSGKVAGPAYVKIIEEALQLFIENTFDAHADDYIFIHDNAPPHRSKFEMQWLKSNGSKVLKWPATSPDLNSIENMWDHIDKQLKKMKPTNLN